MTGVIVTAPVYHVLPLLSVGQVIVVPYEAHHCVICILNDVTGCIFGIAAAHHQWKQQRSQESPGGRQWRVGSVISFLH